MIVRPLTRARPKPSPVPLPAASNPTSPRFGLRLSLIVSRAGRAKRRPSGAKCAATENSPLKGSPRTLAGEIVSGVAFASAPAGTVSVSTVPSAARVLSVPPAGPIVACFARRVSRRTPTRPR